MQAVTMTLAPCPTLALALTVPYPSLTTVTMTLAPCPTLALALTVPHPSLTGYGVWEGYEAAPTLALALTVPGLSLTVLMPCRPGSCVVPTGKPRSASPDACMEAGRNGADISRTRDYRTDALSFYHRNIRGWLEGLRAHPARRALLLDAKERDYKKAEAMRRCEQYRRIDSHRDNLRLYTFSVGLVPARQPSGQALEHSVGAVLPFMHRQEFVEQQPQRHECKGSFRTIVQARWRVTSSGTCARLRSRNAAHRPTYTSRAVMPNGTGLSARLAASCSGLFFGTTRSPQEYSEGTGPENVVWPPPPGTPRDVASQLLDARCEGPVQTNDQEQGLPARRAVGFCLLCRTNDGGPHRNGQLGDFPPRQPQPSGQRNSSIKAPGFFSVIRWFPVSVQQFPSWEDFYAQVRQQELVSYNRDNTGWIELVFAPTPGNRRLNESQKTIAIMMRQIVRGEKLDDLTFPPIESVGAEDPCSGLDNLFQSPGDGLVPGQMRALRRGSRGGPRASRKSDYTIQWTKQVANPTEGQAIQTVQEARLEILKQASDLVKKNPFSLQAIYVLFNRPRNRSCQRIAKKSLAYFQEQTVRKTIIFGLNTPDNMVKLPTESQKKIAFLMQQLVKEEIPECLCLSPAWNVDNKDFLDGLDKLSRPGVSRQTVFHKSYFWK
eukprot:g63984.t1